MRRNCLQAGVDLLPKRMRMLQRFAGLRHSVQHPQRRLFSALPRGKIRLPIAREERVRVCVDKPGKHDAIGKFVQLGVAQGRWKRGNVTAPRNTPVFYRERAVANRS